MLRRRVRDSLLSDPHPLSLLGEAIVLEPLLLVRRALGMGDHPSRDLASLADEDDVRGLVAFLVRRGREGRLWIDSKRESRSACRREIGVGR